MGIVVDGKLGHAIWVCERASESEWTSEAAWSRQILRITRAFEQFPTAKLFIETTLPNTSPRIKEYYFNDSGNTFYYV